VTVPGDGSLRVCPNPDCPHREATGNAAEYRAEVAACADCGTPLVDPGGVEETSAAERIDLRRLDEPIDPALAPIVVAMLEEAGIRHDLTGEGVQDLFGAGRLGTGWNVLTGPVRLRVESARLDEARRVVDAARSAEIEPEGEDADPD